jgi:hypothetical protein
LAAKYPEQIAWTWLSQNPNAIHLLEKNIDKICWNNLSRNTNPAAINLLEQNPDKIEWKGLSLNSSAIKLLEQNPDKIDWFCLSKNPNAIHLITSLNYHEMQRTFQPLAKELIETVFHPTRVSRIAQVYRMDLNEYLDYYV